ncbi:sucrose-6-phosphate hydrolase [Treponema phagedenis]|uniref:Sucrose-6-phosphate hydrolase n=1 Tax=Treponema phagedenis TaxID=162 RepID=A0A0B7H1W7_TREPH|nr:hypothetical protein [Treponema phagedenis]EFW38617.1 hypothetical protein HMPREF9554_00918 [Treponema phagedenis F0421]NVP24296.1 sucrose-6-phosphate hydrolase [Treponema phagedenis]QEJ94268.1 sucrose-6-phosphate hydrolase [Treponema phagedenis]QEJ99106.1 sucrose-6-phosphate hydrolase [Treponema phagedenis]QEK00226.1 sucrose-6-phosphate hydrolase [Treponema phagedenis]
MDDHLVYLDTYILQQDMRVRLPKSILTNMPVEKGISKFAIYMDCEKNELILRICDMPVENKK